MLLPVLFSVKAVVGLSWKHSDGGTPFVSLGNGISEKVSKCTDETHLLESLPYEPIAVCPSRLDDTGIILE